MSITVSSAGLHTIDGAVMDAFAAEQSVLLGGELLGSTSRRIRRESAVSSTLILTMTRSQQIELVKEYPSTLKRTFTLGHFARLIQSDDVVQLVAGGQVSVPRIVSAAFLAIAAMPARDADDIPDPVGRSREFHAMVANRISEAIELVAAGLFVDARQ